jgi:hypothetical protein
MPDLLRELSIVTVNLALARRHWIWGVDNSHVDNEQAYLDRLVLAEYIDTLRDELRDTQEAQTEAESEVERLLEVINNITASDHNQ